MRSIVALCVASLALLAAPPAHGYCLAPTNPAGTINWSQMPVPFRVHDTGSSAGTKAGEFAAVRAAFAEWAAAPCSSLAFPEGAVIPAGEAVSLYPTERGTRVYWARTSAEWGDTDTSPIAKTFYSFDAHGALVAAVSVLNALGTYQWSTTGKAGTFDVQGVMAFQIGRLIGVAPSNVATAVMYVPFMAGDLTKRQLTSDDVAAVGYLYPKAGADSSTCPLTTPAASCAGPAPPRPDANAQDGGVPAATDAGTPGDGAPPPPDPGRPDGPGSPGADGGFRCAAHQQCESGICGIDGVCVAHAADGGSAGCHVGEHKSPGNRGGAAVGLVFMLALTIRRLRRRG